MPDPRSLAPPSTTDPRDLKAGHMVSDRNGYYDSQNIVGVSDETGRVALSVVLHHSENREGGPGLQLFSTRSVDGGRTWSPLSPIDDDIRQSHDGYQLLHRRPDGGWRIFVFYGWNPGSQYPPDSAPDLPELKRTDMQLDEGYWFRVSDDGGASWGDRRWLIPVRRTRIDRDNPWGGSTMGMFLCDKPSVVNGAVYMAFQKTRDGAGETPGSEVFLLRSRNLLHVDDLDDAEWETLPHGDVGLQAPSGDLALGEEPHVLQVGAPHADRLFCLWRAETGRLAASYSDDSGESWDEPFWLTHEGHAGGGHPLKNPRGSITPFRLSGSSPDGMHEFVMLYYNNGRTERLGYVGRRVYWLVCGRSTPDGHIRWGQPEIALWWDGTGFEDRPGWNPDWAIVDGPGYPDFVEFDDATLAFVESNKLAVRYHVVDQRLLAHLRAQPDLVHVTGESLS
ncbi:MAG: sialidase family protein [Ilumatobacteraceae bacterium]